MTAIPAKPVAVWITEQTEAFLKDRGKRGNFYVIWSDNDVFCHHDEKLVAGATADTIENRPALSRWHPGHAEAVATHIAS